MHSPFCGPRNNKSGEEASTPVVYAGKDDVSSSISMEYVVFERTRAGGALFRGSMPATSVKVTRWPSSNPSRSSSTQVTIVFVPEGVMPAMIPECGCSPASPGFQNWQLFHLSLSKCALD